MQRCIALFVGLAALSSCDSVPQATGTIGELQQLQQSVGKAVGGGDVNINLSNGKYLYVGIVNSPLKDLPSDQKKAKALEVAKLCYKSYPEATNLEQISVAFVAHHSILGIFNYTDATDSFSFLVSDLSDSKDIDSDSGH